MAAGDGRSTAVAPTMAMDDNNGTGNPDESPVLAYALATSALLFAACVMCFLLMCCAKCPEWRRRRQQKLEKERLLQHCDKVKFSSKYDHSTSDTCVICLEEFREKESIIVCPCRHGYHKRCLSGWLIHSPCCPVCKTSVATEKTPLATPTIAYGIVATPTSPYGAAATPTTTPVLLH